MVIKEQNLHFFSEKIQIRSLTNDDLNNNISWFKKFWPTEEPNIDNEKNEKIEAKRQKWLKIANVTKDDILKGVIYEFTKLDKFFFISKFFIILIDNLFVGLFWINTDNTIKFKSKKYCKNICQIHYSFIDSLENEKID